MSMMKRMTPSGVEICIVSHCNVESMMNWLVFILIHHYALLSGRKSKIEVYLIFEG